MPFRKPDVSEDVIRSQLTFEDHIANPVFVPIVVDESQELNAIMSQPSTTQSSTTTTPTAVPNKPHTTTVTKIPTSAHVSKTTFTTNRPPKATATAVFKAEPTTPTTPTQPTAEPEKFPVSQKSNIESEIVKKTIQSQEDEYTVEATIGDEVSVETVLPPPPPTSQNSTSDEFEILTPQQTSLDNTDTLPLTPPLIVEETKPAMTNLASLPPPSSPHPATVGDAPVAIEIGSGDSKPTTAASEEIPVDPNATAVRPAPGIFGSVTAFLAAVYSWSTSWIKWIFGRQ